MGGGGGGGISQKEMTAGVKSSCSSKGVGMRKV